MNSSINKLIRTNESEFPTRPCKKQRRRHRNRYKNYNLRKKKIKKIPSTIKIGFSKSDIFNSKPDCEKIMSNWYWSNYRKAVEWQERHKVAHWKACALALFEENRYLLEIINHLQPNVVPGISATPQAVGREINFNSKQMRVRHSENFSGPAQNYIVDDASYSNQDENNTADGDENTEEIENDIEFEMSEEMMQFFEQSYKHKMDMKKLKEKADIINTEQQIQELQNNKIKRSTEMKFLYGDGACMITGMEAAVQLSFNKYCDITSPNYWPNIPFRL